jgi:hypothetical protein
MVHAMAAEKRREQLAMVLVGAEVGRGHKSKVIQGKHAKKHSQGSCKCRAVQVVRRYIVKIRHSGLVANVLGANAVFIALLRNGRRGDPASGRRCGQRPGQHGH